MASPSGGPLLTLDRGNSTLDCLLHGAAGAEADRLRLPAADPAALLAWLGARRPATAVGVTVIPGGLEAVLAALRRLGTEVLQVPVDLPCPLGMAYRTPETLGADRWLAALAAHRSGGAAVVADLGSATTVDAVSAEGVFLGGCIAPGLEALAEGMAARTPALPRVPPATGELPPQTTREAVAAGLLHGYAGMVDRLIADMRSALPGKPRVWLTGGTAETVLPHLHSEVRHEPALVHEGLRLTWEAACAS